MKTSLLNTGERLLPGDMNRTALEHLHRYAFAREICRGKRVLDVASGEGYGTYQLAEVAASVVGVELSAQVVEHARASYRRDNLSFLQGDLEELPVETGDFDCVTCFETIEHVGDQPKAVAQLKRALKAGGVCFISTPCREEYNRIATAQNSFHTHEMEIPEFRALLAPHFARVAIYTQRVVYASAIVPEEGDPLPSKLQQADFEAPKNARWTDHPIYALAVASDGDLPLVPSSLLEIGTQVGEVHDLAVEEWKQEALALRASTSFRVGHKIVGPLHKLLRRS